MRGRLQRVLQWPSVVWVLLGLCAAYFAFMIVPVFLNSALDMQFFNYVPAIHPIGIDFRITRDFSQMLWVDKQSPYNPSEWPNLYTPFVNVVYGVFLLTDWASAYRAISVLTVLCYFLATLAIPYWIRKERSEDLSPVAMLLFVTGLFSYGLQFELERGQFNVIAFSLSLSAIYLWHYRRPYRFLAYVLLSVAIQLKIYPAIFAIMFIDDWRDWRGNLTRLSGLAVANFATLFILGPRVFLQFLRVFRRNMSHPFMWMGNHSIKSFVAGLPKDLWGGHSQWIEYALMVTVALCLMVTVWIAYQRRVRGFNGALLLVVALAALLIPATSHDYTLSLLAAPLAVVLPTALPDTGGRIRVLAIGLVLVISAAYSSTLFSFTNKPVFVQNNAPALLFMLFSSTLLMHMSGRAQAGGGEPDGMIPQHVDSSGGSGVAGKVSSE